jgi:glycerol-3-phosphate dehydrogenase
MPSVTSDPFSIRPPAARPPADGRPADGHPSDRPPGRADQLDALAGGDPADVLIVGGGIVGAGVARDAALRGLSTVVVDRGDFAFGTSSRSSRLLHGGLRYLAQGRVGLVHEASTEKVTLARIAPHLAQPLPFVFPTYKGDGWPRWKLRIGVKLYDLLCGGFLRGTGGNLGKSSAPGPDAVLAMLPGLTGDKLTGAVRYYDGLTNDARLVLDTLRSAAAAGAACVNYLELTSADRRGDLWHCRLRDAETGRDVTVTARTVVNAAGAWASRFPASKVKLRLTKGVHLVVDKSRMPVNEAVVMTEGTRILFAIPWGERTILGTTDTDYAGPADAPDCTADDVSYVLGITNRAFPSAKLAAADVISAWSGLRPLIADPNGKPSDISRAHQILESDEPGWLDVAGGKLTTYRRMAEQAVDKVAAYLSRGNPSGRQTPACRTADEPILPAGDVGYSGIEPPAVSRAAVEHFCRREWARHLDDVMIRRTSWRYYHRDHLAVAEQAVGWMAETFNWSADVAEAELDRYRRMTRPLAAAWEPPAGYDRVAGTEVAADRPAATARVGA